jgi:cytochrome c oxidase subunit II
MMGLFNAGFLNNIQSAFHPVSSASRDIKDLTWYLIIMCTVVFIATMLLLITGLKKKGSAQGNSFILWSGLYIPAIILLGTLFYSLKSSLSIRQMNQQEDVLLIRFTGHQFWWEVHYPEFNITDANEIYVPVGKTIRLELKSQDVIHSFWIPNVHGKMDMLPEMKTYLTFQVDKPGKYRGQCAEFCGPQHALMAYWLVALPVEEFEQWVAQRQKSNLTTLSATQEQGKEIYFRESCHTCHAIKGTSFAGRSGPDLTHLASRLTLAAGSLPNNRENLGQWILHSQKIKPVNRMPEYPYLTKDDLEVLLDYLMTLK